MCRFPRALTQCVSRAAVQQAVRQHELKGEAVIMHVFEPLFTAMIAALRDAHALILSQRRRCDAIWAFESLVEELPGAPIKPRLAMPRSAPSPRRQIRALGVIIGTCLSPHQKHKTLSRPSTVLRSESHVKIDRSKGQPPPFLLVPAAPSESTSQSSQDRSDH
jgi:hypothetical protein